MFCADTSSEMEAHSSAFWLNAVKHILRNVHNWKLKIL